MRKFTALTIALLSTLALAASPGASQSLFTTVGPANPDGQPPIGVNNVYNTTVDLNVLEPEPKTLTVDLPIGPVILAQEHVDTFAADHYTWTGEGGGYIASFTYYKGTIAGTFWGTPRYTLQLRLHADVDKDLAPQHVLSEVGAQPYENHPPPPVPLKGISEVRRPRPAPLPASWDETLVRTAGEKNHFPEVIDQVIFYTDGALVDVGTVLNIEAIGQQGVTEINTALLYSNLDFFVRAVAIEPLPGFVESANGYETRDELQVNPVVQSRRRATGADTVAVITRDFGNFCGVAFVQRPGCGDSAPIAGCGMGLDHASHSLSWSRWSCIQNWGAASHEFGHLGSGEHQPGSSVPDEDLARPYCHAHALPEGAPDRKTAVWSGGWDWELIPHYSDSQIVHDGHATGIPDVAENARAMREFLVTMPLYDTVVLLDGFESGSTEVWSEETP